VLLDLRTHGTPERLPRLGAFSDSSIRGRALVFCLAAISLVGCAKRVAPETAHRFEHAEEWAARFEDPTRDAWQQPNEVVAALGLPEDAALADLGAATGYFSVRFARALPRGLVYGVDVESSMVDYLQKRAEAEQLKNLVTVLAEYDDAKLPAAVDCILIVNTYHHLEDRPAYFKRLLGRLKPKGRVVIIDFKRGSKLGPPDAEKVTPAQVQGELAQAGLTQTSSWSFLPEQYFLAFARP
jgi:ubiquinone/menaquinone biosynthesis C-methylase UbiE